MRRFVQATAAWRISIWTTVAFAMGTAVAFSIVYFFVAKAIQERSDAWLRGEAEVLARVSADTPRDHLYNRIVGEVAELAAQELPDERNARGQRLNSVFFLESDSEDKESLLWVGPGSVGAFLRAIQGRKIVPGIPQAIRVEGWTTTFRVVAREENGRRIYLGLSSHGSKHLLRTLTFRFLVLWTSTVLMGFLISYLSAHRTLHRVQGITDAVAGIDSNDLGQRLQQPENSDEISRLTEAFNHLLERIQSSVNELRTVTDTVAHDLRSPVTSIRGTLESVLSTEPNEKWRDSVGDAVEGLDRLLSALNTTLDVAEAQAGALRLERSEVDLSAAVKRLVEFYQPALDERKHELKVDIENGVTVDADAKLLNRVLSNLIENEIAHLPAGCQVTIRLRARDGSAILEFEDNGPGFPPDIGSHAFERFVKGKNSHGHGLGLAFVDAVVRTHGGTARISANPLGGAMVTMVLPECAPNSTGSELSNEEPNHSTPQVTGCP
jgi:signal transduction histidine kinase